MVVLGYAERYRFPHIALAWRDSREHLVAATATWWVTRNRIPPVKTTPEAVAGLVRSHCPPWRESMAMEAIRLVRVRLGKSTKGRWVS